MKFVLFVLILVLLIFGIYFGYYLINPSQKGKRILDNLNIPQPTVIAHRGASTIAPESTRPAYIKAVQLGADYIEADIHRTSDGKIVVIHNSTLKRTSNIENIYPDKVNKHISKFTYEELLKLDFGSWFNKKYPKKSDESFIGLDIIRLEELIEIAEQSKKSTGIVLDIKDIRYYPNIEADIIKILKKKKWYKDYKDNTNSLDDSSKVLIFSFNLNTLKKFKDLAPGIPRVLLLSSNMMHWRKWDRWLEIADENVHGLGVKGFISWPWHVAAAHKRGLFVYPYVINEFWQLQILAQIETSGYITNRPHRVLEFLEKVPTLIELEIE